MGVSWTLLVFTINLFGTKILTKILLTLLHSTIHWYVNQYVSTSWRLILKYCLAGSAQKNLCRHNVEIELWLHEKLWCEPECINLIKDHNHQPGVTNKICIMTFNCLKNMVDVLSLLNNDFSRVIDQVFWPMPFARKIVQVNRLPCKSFSSTIENVRRGLRRHVSLGQSRSTDLLDTYFLLPACLRSIMVHWYPTMIKQS